VNALLCTLGSSWAVIAEIFGWLAPGVLDLYAHHPRRAELDALRAANGLRAPDELWVCTTEGAQTADSLRLLDDWWARLGRPLPLRVWTAADTDQLASQTECDAMRELTLRVTLLASERCAGGGQLILSLAGGRKTMSADLQGAGSVFGAAAWLHVVSPEPAPPALFARTSEQKQEQPALFSRPLHADLAVAITPLVAGSASRSELLDVTLDDGAGPVSAARFGVPLAQPGCVCRWQPPAPDAQAWLDTELRQRQRAGSQLLGNYLHLLAQSEHHDNWRSLYRLPPAAIDRLRATRLGDSHLGWLAACPKADLHRHLGGCLSLEAQRQVARAIWADTPEEIRRQRMQDVRELLSDSQWPWNWPQRLRHGTDGIGRAQRSAAVLLHASDAALNQALWGETEPRVALKHRHPHGFAAYERPGELSGSALLAHPAALPAYATAVVAQARAEGLAYLELRGSPHKYRAQDAAQFVRDLRTALQAAGAHCGGESGATPVSAAQSLPLRVGFVWILDRRDPAALQKAVQSALAAKAQEPDFMLGLDVAGDEAQALTDVLVHAFAPAFEACLPITIHAGEGEAAERIWQAAYQLHADRIGHGLSLADHPQLAARFRDRGICLELCPTSNHEVVGYADPAVPQSLQLPGYPLHRFIELGLPITLCTDNPGISRTTLADEYLTAARMSPQGLTQWQALALMRQAFVHSFLPADQREALLKSADAQLFHRLTTSE